MDPDALRAFRLAIVDEVPVADSEDDVENVFAYHVATTPAPTATPSYAPTREKDKEDRRRLSLVPPCQGGLVEFDVRCRWLAPVDNVNVTRAEGWCRRTVRNQLRYSLGNGTLATAFETRGNNTALAGAIINANATLAEFEDHSSIEEVLTDAPTPATWSDNCECVPAAPTKILTLQTAAASPERETSSARSEVAVRAAFAKDPYACAGVLGKKRAGRDPFNVGQPYERTNPDLADLFRHCAATTFEGPLPW